MSGRCDLVICLRLPMMRQQFFNAAIVMGWQARQHIFQISMRIVTVQSGRMNQAHYRRSTTPRPQ